MWPLKEFFFARYPELGGWGEAEIVGQKKKSGGSLTGKKKLKSQCPHIFTENSSLYLRGFDLPK